MDCKKKLLVLLAAVFMLPSPLARAHEFFLVPEKWETYKTGQVLPLSIYSTHYFMKGEEIEDIKLNALSYDGKDIPLTTNESWLTHDAKIELKKGGAAVIAGHRQPILWSITPDGEGDGGRDKNKNAIKVTRYEKFAKLILPVDGNSQGFNAKTGQRLEIIPIDNPLEAKVGDEPRFRVLLDGKPAIFDMVYATYDGFSDIANAWAFSASPSSHGEAKIRISNPGLWLVRVSIDIEEKTSEYDAVNLKATLLFPVK